MIIKIHASGKSFKGLVRYLAHDPKAQTKDRLAWTYTLNTASDDPSLALHEIYWTYKAADELKKEAGIRRGGRRLEAPVKHFSLSWSPDDQPSREHMIATVENFLQHMRWSDHQAILFAHNDTAHPHVHVVLNAVHPETGRKLDERNDWERAKPWGLTYELARGEVRCKQRLSPPEERTPAPTRATWQQLKEYERADEAYERNRVAGQWDYLDRKNPEMRRDREWEALKEHQKQEREDFFTGGKQVYRDVSQQAYRKVRQAFRPEWKEFYAAQRDGQEKADLDRIKADILARQRAALEDEWKHASVAKRAERDKEYAAINSLHREQRRELRQAQEQGRTFAVLDILAGQSRTQRPDHEPDSVPQRSRSTSRGTWEPLRQYRDRERDGYLDQATPQDRARQERAVLRGGQKAEREAFRAQGKGMVRVARKEACESVKTEMASTFSAIEQARLSGNRSGLSGLRFIRRRQVRETSKLRSDVAALTVKDQRKNESQKLKVRHQAERHVLRRRNIDGLRSYRVMDHDRSLITAADAASQAQARDEAKQREWRQSKPQPPASMATLETDAARFKATLLATTERVTKAAEFEDRVKLSWRRMRPGPGRGRD